MAQKISLTRALATVKSLENKIEKATATLTLFGIQKGIGTFATMNGTSKTPEEFKQSVKEAYQALGDMLATRTAIKRAIILANAHTMVTVGKTEMTIAEAIELKRSIQFDSQLVVALRKALVASNFAFTTEKRAFDDKIDRTKETYTSGRDKKISEEDLNTLTKPIENKDFPTLIDPIGMAEQEAEISSKIEDFMLNVDFALSEVNAKTEIEIP